MKTTLRIPILLSITRLGKSAYGMETTSNRRIDTF
jgi:hypothetical protein